jgi:4-amino-4-deoxy-L-arabinose transferase-like glycosyltransferase
MSPADFGRRACQACERLYDALIDPARCERTMAVLLGGYAAVWTLYGVIAKGSQDIHFDMGEMVAWSHEIGLGTPKHPPLGAWLVRAWFDVMPAEPWAFYLLAVLLATAALWIAWRVAGRYLAPDKRVLGIALLTLVPFYNFHALKFNANTVLIPFWAATTWFFLRSFETRRAGWAVLAGLGAAAAMLGKYWSIFLLAGLGLAALSDPRRGAYFRSPAPWLTIAIGAIPIVPHVVWVIEHNFEPFSYALAAHPTTFVTAAEDGLTYLVGVWAFIIAPLGLGLVATRPSLAAVFDALWPAAGERRTIVIAFMTPLFLAVIVAILLRAQIGALWTMSAMTLLPVVQFSTPLVTVTRTTVVRLLALAIAYPIAMAALSPAIAIVIHREGVPNYGSQYRLIAQEVASAWQARTAAPLRIVGSETTIVNGIVFYFAEQPSTFDILSPGQTPWVDAARIRRDGIAIVCPLREKACVSTMNDYAARNPGLEIKEVNLARLYFGSFDTPVRYRILIVPPH